MEKIDTCAVCRAELPIRLLRYNKCKLSGAWEYQCSDCRSQIKIGALIH